MWLRMALKRKGSLPVPIPVPDRGSRANPHIALDRCANIELERVTSAPETVAVVSDAARMSSALANLSRRKYKQLEERDIKENGLCVTVLHVQRLSPCLIQLR